MAPEALIDCDATVVEYLLAFVVVIIAGSYSGGGKLLQPSVDVLRKLPLLFSIRLFCLTNFEYQR